MIFIWFIYAAWVLLIVYLTVHAIGVKRDTEPHLLQSFGLMFAMIAAFLLPRVQLFAFVNFAPVNAVLSSVGVVLAVAGMFLLVWARQTLGRNWSQTVSAKQDHELVTSGPYRRLRHPMYTGGLLACIGSAIVVGGPFVFLLLLLGAIFIWRVGAEDRLLARQFPDEFPGYARRTNALIPFVW
ncbi:isoprenylcysteine carboxylmethyltransferase family protein [Mesorhizobium sp. M1E.F.Ca.ET.045.02.1.1]|uniref:methyltransferase family protein n=1 Tax=unclassified Mesorhizobium TaxID=325217 RepID=UPI000F74F251|nr:MULTISPECIES: isoprenylcysteine carboxylmethyltransferase family protein [unclassified Mesorhizobium]AZO24143.1 isoprenylcysteine carboxylmethyltransferase family protein [Mesorhizobium sp. M1E.F.Ca.ET.045.02.1.1]RUW73550.1 isoprenylcysteine carboxylmethyltransferase family protein [Mesorhizobium sp. M1E.F.Ca.ET.063.01.1.1]RWB53510.1 MAG: isoprenylcysteine carboxylmethyltransferase family protein [Mesorhizobium sp.]TKB14169.1 MAG: isoprenylcysteine carboxylmethyltransferase family protein [M